MKPTLPDTNAVELLKQGKKDKKKKIKVYKQDTTRERKKQTLTTGNNIIDILKKKKHDINKVTCFNYNKKGYYSSSYVKLLKKLVLVLAISVSMTGVSEKVIVRVPYIFTWFDFKKAKDRKTRSRKKLCSIAVARSMP